MTIFSKQAETLAKTVAMVAATALVASATIASADPHDQLQNGHQQSDRNTADQHAGGQHPGWGADVQGAHQWRQGERMGFNNWNSAQPVDYRAHHLRQPRNGYEWRESNGQYVEVAIATGLIASIILSNGH
jgi:Ni/Co efflux regulator RcnB